MTADEKLAELVVRYRELLSYLESAEARAHRKRCIVPDPDGVDAVTAQGSSYQHDIMVARGMVRDAIADAEERPSSARLAAVCDRMDVVIEQARESDRQISVTRRVA